MTSKPIPTEGLTADLSETMRKAVALAVAHDGVLIRQPGGFWVGQSHADALAGGGSQTPYFATGTVEALVTRKAAEYTEWKEGRSGRFPVAMTVTLAARKALEVQRG